MANIGSFKKVGSDFQGEIVTLSLQTKGMCDFGVEEGPPWRGNRRPKGTPLRSGFTLALVMHGGLERDAGCGDGREDPAGVFCTGQSDQGDLP